MCVFSTSLLPCHLRATLWTYRAMTLDFFFFFRFRFQSLSGYQETSEGDLFVGLSIDKQVMISQTETLSRPSFD